MGLCIILPSKLRRVTPRVDSCLHIILIEYINLASFGITGWYGLVIVARILIQCWINHNNKWAVSNTSSPTFHPLKSQNESTEMKWKELAPVAQRETRSFTCPVQSENSAIHRFLFTRKRGDIHSYKRKLKSSLLTKIISILFFFCKETVLHQTTERWAAQKIRMIFLLTTESSHHNKCTLTAVIEGKLRIRR